MSNWHMSRTNVSDYVQFKTSAVSTPPGRNVFSRAESPDPLYRADRVG